MNTLGINLQNKQFSPILRELAEAQIPLESLYLMQCNLDESLISGIIRLNKLKQLALLAKGKMKLSVSGILATVKNLTELIYLDLKVDSNLYAIDLIIKCGPKLRVLKYRCHVRKSTYYSFPEDMKLDEGVYMKILNVLKHREEKIPLELTYTDNFVPEELKAANKEILKLV